MPIEFPIVEPFEVPGIGVWFSDARDESDSLWQAARREIGETVMAWARETGTREWCADDPDTQAEIERRRSAWIEANPGVDPAVFVDEGGEAIDDVVMDPRLGILRLIARRGERGPVVGGFILQNVRILQDDPTTLGVRLFPIMGVRPRPVMPQPRAWGIASQFFLVSALPLRDGRVLRIQEVDFPETENTSYGLEHGEVMRELWDRLGVVADEERNDSGDVPTRVRAILDRREGEQARPLRLRQRERPGGRDADSQRPRP